jgi:hypothetical protein
MERLELTFIYERPTKNTVRYKEGESESMEGIASTATTAAALYWKLLQIEGGSVIWEN